MSSHCEACYDLGVECECDCHTKASGSPTIREQIEEAIEPLYYDGYYERNRRRGLNTATKSLESLISQSVIEELRDIYGYDDVVYRIEKRIKELKTLANKGGES